MGVSVSESVAYNEMKNKWKDRQRPKDRRTNDLMKAMT